jgi:fusion and transport protein UGO1
MPWEVGKVLLQVQWVPKNLDQHPHLLDLEEEDEENDENDELVG